MSSCRIARLKRPGTVFEADMFGEVRVKVRLLLAFEVDTQLQKRA